MRDSPLITHGNLAQVIAEVSLNMMDIGSVDIDLRIMEVLKKVAEVIRAQRCTIFQFSRGGKNLYASYNWNEKEEQPGNGLSSETYDGDYTWLAERIARLRKGEVPEPGVLNTSATPDRGFLDKLRLGSCLIVPLASQSDSFGFMGCGFDRKNIRMPSNVESTFLSAVARMIANVLGHRKASNSLVSSEKKIQKIMERLSDDYFFYRHDTNRIFTHVSDSVRNVLGYEPGEFLGPISKYLTASPVNEKAAKATRLSIQGVRQDPYEVEAFRKNGEIVTLEVQEISVEHEKGKVVAVEGIAHNITKRKQYEDLISRQKDELEWKVKERTSRLERINKQLILKIKQYEEAKNKIDLLVGELEIILDAVHAAIFYKDLKHRFIRVNKSFAEFFKGKKETFKGKTYFDLGFGRYSAEEFTREDDLIMKTGRAKRQTVSKVVVNNTPKWLVIDKIPYYDINGDIIGIIGFGLDISDFKNAEELIFSLNKKLTEAEEIEHLRISRYLHDTVAQNLSSALIGCNIQLDEYAEKLPEIVPRFDELSRILRKSVEQIRHLSYDLRPPHFEKMGFSNVIHSFCEEFKAKCRVEIDFLSVGMEEIDIDFTLQINLYRIVQEALNNVRKHARAKHVEVRLVASHPDIILRIKDDGQGFLVPDSFDEFLSRKCMGLQGMQERIRLFQGNLQIQSKHGSGTKIFVRVPVYSGKKHVGG